MGRGRDDSSFRVQKLLRDMETRTKSMADNLSKLDKLANEASKHMKLSSARTASVSYRFNKNEDLTLHSDTVTRLDVKRNPYVPPTFVKTPLKKPKQHAIFKSKSNGMTYTTSLEEAEIERYRSQDTLARIRSSHLRAPTPVSPGIAAFEKFFPHQEKFSWRAKYRSELGDLVEERKPGSKSSIRLAPNSERVSKEMGSLKGIDGRDLRVGEGKKIPKRDLMRSRLRSISSLDHRVKTDIVSARSKEEQEPLIPHPPTISGRRSSDPFRPGHRSHSSISRGIYETIMQTDDIMSPTGSSQRLGQPEAPPSSEEQSKQAPPRHPHVQISDQRTPSHAQVTDTSLTIGNLGIPDSYSATPPKDAPRPEVDVSKAVRVYKGNGEEIVHSIDTKLIESMTLQDTQKLARTLDEGLRRIKSRKTHSALASVRDHISQTEQCRRSAEQIREHIRSRPRWTGPDGSVSFAVPSSSLLAHEATNSHHKYE
eukprot:gnl/Carplike_NY0171/4006_a5422_347.p1 GENE.gnl/Carplike_NY0171/4006_a5422_347~~gnl/Carplike_NY0171/4006_a5422_347.p1  ORF type:complete len:482 (-),score=77.21 gnl/Carplike_NY0171/4006_a5422_347:997-2442(-)